MSRPGPPAAIHLALLGIAPGGPASSLARRLAEDGAPGGPASSLARRPAEDD